jgi:hypothetical protein
MPAVSCRGMVIEASRKLYAKDRDTVERIVSDLHTPRPSTSEERSKKSAEKRFNNGNSNNHVNQVRENNNQPVQEKVTQNNQVEQKRDYGVKKTNGEQKTPEDLRQILSKITKTNDMEKKNDFSIKNSKEDFQKNSKKESPEKSNLKNALAEALEKVVVVNHRKQTSTSQEILQSDQLEQKSVSESQHPVFQSATENRDTIKSLNFHQNLSIANSGVRKVVVEHRQSRLPDSDKLPPSNTMSIFHPRSVVDKIGSEPIMPVEDNRLDVKKIKKMLRQNENERSPFN